MKNIRVKTKFDFKALKLANLYVIRVKRKSALIYGILTIICIVAAIYSIITNEDTTSKIAFGVIFGFIAAMSIYNIFTEEKKIEKSLRKFFSTNPAMTQYVSLDEQKLTIIVPYGDKLEKVSYDWAYVQEIHVLNEYYLMFLNGGVPVIIDKREEAMIEGTQDELANLIKEMGSLKPYRVYNKPLTKDLTDPISYVESQEVSLEDVIAKFEEVEVTPSKENNEATISLESENNTSEDANTINTVETEIIDESDLKSENDEVNE